MKKTLTRSPLTRVSRLASVVFAMIFGGCAIGTPFPRLHTSNAAERDREVVLVITRIAVNPNERREFDRQTSLVIDSMTAHSGLLGYSARRELFGVQGWTFSAWTNDDARRNFVRSAMHRSAIQKSAAAIVTVELKRLTLPLGKLPSNWKDALALFATPENKRTYVH